MSTPLSVRIQELANAAAHEDGPEVHFELPDSASWPDGRKLSDVEDRCRFAPIGRVNRALAACARRDRVNLVTELLQLWRGRFTQRDYETRMEAGEVFRGAYDSFGTETMATLTADGKQFRMWYGIPPGIIAPTHVESAGRRGLLFQVNGKPDDVLSFVVACTGHTRQYWGEIKLENGCKLYLPWSNS